MTATNLTDLTVDSLTLGSTSLPYPASNTSQLVVADGAITIKMGVVTLAKTVAGAMTITLAQPTATTDDWKVMSIISLQAQANTVAIAATGFGNGGANFIKATFGGAIGDSMQVMAYQGFWYVIGLNNVTLGVA